MDDQGSNIEDLSTPLILTNPIPSFPDISIEILKIRDLIQIKYFNKINSSQNYKFLLNKNFMTIKKEVMDIMEAMISLILKQKIKKSYLKS